MKLILAVSCVFFFMLITVSGVPLPSVEGYMAIGVDQLECYNCGSVGRFPDTCNKASICPPNNACFISFTTTGMGGNYNISCIDDRLCSPPAGTETVSGVFYKFECCYTPRCNRHYLN